MLCYGVVQDDFFFLFPPGEDLTRIICFIPLTAAAAVGRIENEGHSNRCVGNIIYE